MSETSNSRLKYLDKKLKEKQRQLKKLQSFEIKQDKRELRRQRAHKLIQLGVLFEMLELDQEDKDILMGYLLKYKSLQKCKKEKLKGEGKTFFKERSKKTTIPKNRNITSEEIKELLSLCTEHRCNPFPMLQEKYQVKLLENLCYWQYLEVKAYLLKK